MLLFIFFPNLSESSVICIYLYYLNFSSSILFQNICPFFWRSTLCCVPKAWFATLPGLTVLVFCLRTSPSRLCPVSSHVLSCCTHCSIFPCRTFHLIHSATWFPPFPSVGDRHTSRSFDDINDRCMQVCISYQACSFSVLDILLLSTCINSYKLGILLFSESKFTAKCIKIFFSGMREC